MVPIKEALTFDDVTLAPKYSEILPSEVDTSVKLTNQLKLRIPLISSAMDTVTESKMAIAIAKAGGIGVIHRNLDIKKQIEEIKKVKKLKLLVGAAVGAGPKELQRAKEILKQKVDLIVVDTAHGHSRKVFEIVKYIKKIKDKKIALCAGNIATPEAAKFLIKLGVDIIKVGIGPGSICTTRLVAGIGVPQLSAIINVKSGVKKKNIKLINNKPLISHTIEAALKSKKVKDIFISTDDKRIVQIAKKYNIKIPYLRPKRLASDRSPAIQTYLHTIDYLNKNKKEKIKNFVVLLPTAPLRKPKDIDNAISLFFKKKADSVISMCKTHHPIEWQKKIDKKKKN